MRCYVESLMTLMNDIRIKLKSIGYLKIHFDNWHECMNQTISDAWESFQYLSLLSETVNLSINQMIYSLGINPCDSLYMYTVQCTVLTERCWNCENW